MALWACGGATSEHGDAGLPSRGPSDASSSDVNSDASSADVSSEAAGPGCPPTAPVVGSPCASEFDVPWCEYGNSPSLACDGVFECAGVQGWQPAPPTEFPVPTCVTGTCPASYSDAMTSPSRAPLLLECAYPDGDCVCQSKGWDCSQSYNAPDCPVPRPRLGTACSADFSQSCGHSPCSGGIAVICTCPGLLLGETCDAGASWQRIPTPCPAGP
jgi:hypothetical protein